jgi:L-2-hydroxyglutarate oxidase
VKAKSKYQSDYLIVGAGIIGLAIARELRNRNPDAKITVLEKEKDVAFHGSGRNSGVLHAGFYYSADSLKAKFTADGNRAMRAYCAEHRIPINESKKVVVASDQRELDALYELERRGKKNGCEVSIVDEKELAEIEPNARTFGKALFSPQTATVDPIEVCHSLKQVLQDAGVGFHFETPYRRKIGSNTIETDDSVFEFEKLINCGGLYADQIARDFGFSQNFSILPFKGIYLKYTLPDHPIRTNIYPVPNLKNPFLGVHFTITQDGHIKIGPTAIPAFWRENYRGFEGIKFKELFEILGLESRLFISNKFGFRTLSLEEMRKYWKSHFIKLAQGMVKTIDPAGFTEWTRPGIRAQLLNLKTLELVQDFVVEGDFKSVHILNAVSPAFTGSMPFAKWVVDHYVERART